MSALAVVVAGPMSTLQDSGRWGWQRFGVSPAGAMDAIAHAAANALAGNAPDAAVIEITLSGDTLEVEADSARIAVAAEAAIAFDGTAAPGWRSFTLRRGQRLAIGPVRRGARGYIAVAGGFAVEKQLGSRSVHARTGVGGAPLKAGDRLALARPRAPDGPDVKLDGLALPYLAPPIRVVLGPQDDRFTARGIETFLGGEYRVSAEADRMGYRLEGPEIEHEGGFDTISDGIVFGSIQVPGTRLPIVLMADRQTAGGYPKIATVASASLPTLAQLKPGDALRFAAVTPAEARDLLRRQRAALARLAPMPAFRDPRDLSSEALLAENLIGGVVGHHD